MVKNYLKVALRSLLKNKAFSFINVIGLALGIAASLLIFQYVSYELNYDQFYENAQNTYRVKTNRYDKGELSTEWASGVVSIGPLLTENLPEVTNYARLRNSTGVISYEDKEFKEDQIYFVNNAVFEVFDLQLLHGNSETALTELYAIAISETTALKYFGETDVVGKTLSYNKSRDLRIDAVFKDVPQNAHMKFDILVSWSTIAQGERGQDMNTVWYWDGYYNYIVLADGNEMADFEAKVADFVDKQWGEDMRNSDSWMDFEFQPISDIHLYSNFIGEAEVNGDGDAVYALFGISFFIILIAWVNYINLATAKSLERAKEVGLRKVMGSQRAQLVIQFMTESFLVNLLAVILAFGIVLMVLPSFAQLADQPLNFTLFMQQGFWLSLGVLFMVGTFLSGVYPAFVLSSHKPISTLKGSNYASKGGAWLRRGLVVFQFMASVGLMIGTYVVYEQVSFMRNQDLGVDIDRTLVVRGPSVTDSAYTEKLTAFNEVLKTNAAVENVVVSSGVPGRAVNWNAGGVRLASAPENEAHQFRVLGIGYDFIETYDLALIAGRSFDKSFGTEEENIIFSRSAAQQLGFDDPEEAIGKKIYFWGDVYTLVGVLEDYHHTSLKENYDDLIFRMIPYADGFYSIKYNGENTGQIVTMAEENWAKFFPGNPFEYFFLDDRYEEQYKADKQFGTVFTVFSGLAIFVACLGLFGLAAFITAKRTKEIGIRKVLGANISSILSLLSTDFLRLIMVSVVLAVPVSYFGMSEWLNGFAFRIDLQWYIFLIPAVVVFLIALATVSFQTTRAAGANPIDSLRYE